MLFNIFSRLISRYRYLSLISSPASSACLSISNGGVLDFERSVTSEIITSISPVVILRFVWPSGRGRTLPVALITYSLRKPSAVSQACLSSFGSNTTCVSPYLSLRSIKIIPPWSRRLLTQPHSVTSSQILSFPRVLQSCVRNITKFLQYKSTQNMRAFGS